MCKINIEDSKNCLYCKNILLWKFRYINHIEVSGAIQVNTPFFFCQNDVCIYKWFIKQANKGLNDNKQFKLLNEDFIEKLQEITDLWT